MSTTVDGYYNPDGSRRDFNPNQLVADRSGQKIPIGDRVFHQLRRTNKVMRKVRDLLRANERETRPVQRQIDGVQAKIKLAEKADEHPGELLGQLADLEDELEQAQDDQLLYKQLALLIADEHGEPPPVE